MWLHREPCGGPCAHSIPPAEGQQPVPVQTSTSSGPFSSRWGKPAASSPGERRDSSQIAGTCLVDPGSHPWLHQRCCNSCPGHTAAVTPCLQGFPSKQRGWCWLQSKLMAQKGVFRLQVTFHCKVKSSLSCTLMYRYRRGKSLSVSASTGAPNDSKVISNIFELTDYIIQFLNAFLGMCYEVSPIHFSWKQTFMKKLSVNELWTFQHRSIFI